MMTNECVDFLTGISVKTISMLLTTDRQWRIGGPKRLDCSRGAECQTARVDTCHSLSRQQCSWR